jgi:predicted RNase H-like HicB family nuclease
MSKSKVSFLLNVDICVEKDEGKFHAFCPAFKGLRTEGDTLREAIDNAKTAVSAYVISLIKHKEPIPCCRIVRKECPDENIHNEDVNIPEMACA